MPSIAVLTFMRVCLAAAVLAFSVQAAQAGTARVAAGGGVLSVPVTSYQERFFKTVIAQQFDYSCGSAAVATLLTYHYETPTSEADAFLAMWEIGDQERIQEVGFSLLDIKTYLETRGFPADGFRVPLDSLSEAGVPAITLIETNGYRHFVVIKGIAEGKVLVGDPALGIKSYNLETFDELRVDDIVFVIRSHAEVARANFNRAEEWRLRQARAPIHAGLDRADPSAHGHIARIPAQPFPRR